MARCIQEQDFPGFAELTMKDSNQFHATCLDTFPPISYLNDTSRRIMQLVHRFNAYHGQTKVLAQAGMGMAMYAQQGWLQAMPGVHFLAIVPVVGLLGSPITTFPYLQEDRVLAGGAVWGQCVTMWFPGGVHI